MKRTLLSGFVIQNKEYTSCDGLFIFKMHVSILNIQLDLNHLLERLTLIFKYEQVQTFIGFIERVNVVMPYWLIF